MARRPAQDHLPDMLAMLLEAGHAEHDAEQRLINAVQRARSAGASWQQIADELGVTKHAAHKRFRRYTEED